MSMDDTWRDVRTFHYVFGHPIAHSPTFLQAPRRDARAGRMLEEIQEFQEAETVHDQVDAMIDLIYFALGTLVELGVRPDGPLNTVQAANMAKLWPDGSARYRTDGKTIKPHGWVDPRDALKAVIDAQAASRSGEVQSTYRYPFVLAQPYLCFAAVIAMIIRAHSSLTISQEELGAILGVTVPKPGDGSAPTSWGIAPCRDSISRAFSALHVPLCDESVHVSELEDWQFENRIADALRQGLHVACGYDYGVLKSGSNSQVGHASLVTAILPETSVTLLDPGPDGFGLQEASAAALYAAVKARSGWLWMFRPTLERWTL